MPMALPPTRDDLAAELKVFIPKIGRWKHDSSCGICGVEFSYVRGRHHCRYCGASVCNKHSRNRAVVPSSMSTERQRVCDECYPKCQYGLTLRRPRGMTTAGESSRGGGSSRGGESARSRNFTLMDHVDSNDPRLVRTERGRARTMMRSGSRSSSGSPSPLRKPDGSTWDPKQRWNNMQASQSPTRGASVARRRGISEPPERHMNYKKPAPKAPPSPPPYMASFSPRKGHGPHMSPKKHFDSPKKPKITKTLSIRKQFGATPPPPPPAPVQKTFHIPPNQPLDASFAMSDIASFSASMRDTKEDDAIAMQYLQSFIKAEASAMTTEQNHVTVSHEASGTMFAMPTVVEMKPASPKELQLAISSTPPVSESAPPRKSQNRKMSTSSTGTISVSDSEELEREKALDKASSSDEEPEHHATTRLDDSVAAAAPLTVEVDEDSSSLEPPAVAKLVTPTTAAKEGRVRFSSSVTFVENPAPFVEEEVCEEGLQLMREIMELEKQIHRHQLELPAMIEEWKRVEHAASLLREDARQSRDKVLQYQKARAAVGRAVRVATKCLQEKEFEAAVLELSRAAAIERTNARVWYMLAESRLHLGQLVEAEEACRVSVELQHSAVGVALLGRILHARGRHDEAIQCYLTALGR